MRRRLKIVRHWLLGRRNGVSLRRIIQFLFGHRCGALSSRMIESIQIVDNCKAVKLKGIERPLMYPAAAPEFALRQVVTEMMYPSNWHSFEGSWVRVGPYDIVLDCGAAEGLFALVVHDRCQHVYAIEPSPFFHEAMDRTFEGVENVTILPVAVGREPREAHLSDEGIGSKINDDGSGSRVRIETLDALFADKGIEVDFIKADLEGFELEMLRGARRILREQRPKLAITGYHSQAPGREIIDCVRAIEPAYEFSVKGIGERNGEPVMVYGRAPY